ncbi:MAG TPA: hypothetical protein VET24_08395 [Actinomycetota bacterium]|nr:hypothetical protein [Actinomycetota bacterium]
MAGPEDLDQVRAKTDKAKDYFSKVPGFETKSWEKPAPPAEEEPAAPECAPTTPRKPEAPLSEAEKYFQKIIGK